MTTEPLTDEALRIAVAEALGWKRALSQSWTNPHGIFTGDHRMPRWSEDLNACHLFEQGLVGDFGLCAQYQTSLAIVCGVEDYGPGSQFLWHATARQRCLAFLRTKGRAV